MALNYRTIWISDVHLGTRGCNAEHLLDFLRHTECEQLYLVGDIIDVWKLKSGWYWPSLHTEVVRAIMGKAKHGTRVIYVPGNHDEFFRQYADMLFLGITIQTNAVHRTADNRTLFVLHGDEFDGVVCNSKWLAYLGSEAYDMLLVANRWFNFFRSRFGFPYWSLSAYLKHKVKNAVKFISHYEEALRHEGLKRGVDGIVCGHIHHAAISEIDDGFTYCNCGDWVENCTALVEDDAGRLSIIRWTEESLYLLNEEQDIENSADKRCVATTD